MKISRLLLICASCLVTVPAVWAQAANGETGSGSTRSVQTGPGILGHFNPRTRTFHALAQAGGDTAELPPLTTFTGTIKLTITVTVKTAGITNVNCFAFVSVQDNPSSFTASRLFGEADVVAATGTGTTRTCTLSVPYSWNLATPSSDMMVTGYEVGNSLVFVNAVLPERSSTLHPVDSRKVPSSGTTTTLTASATI